MRKLSLLYIIAMMCSFSALGQTGTVIDKTSRQGLPGAIIHTNRPFHSVLTNGKGQFSAATFKDADTISVRMMGYVTAFVTYADISAEGFKVELQINPLLLGEAVVSSNRWEENIKETPARIEKLDMKAAALQNPQTTADLLGTSGYAYIQKSQLGGGSPMLRGMATNRVLLVVDGVRMNNAVFRSGNLQNVISLDANALEGTEILFGPGAVMYGSDAIGGVMDFHTLGPKLSDSSGSKPVTTGHALMRTSSANSEATGHMDVNVGWKKWALVSSFTRSAYGDLRSGSVGGDAYFYRPHFVQTIDNVDYMVPNPDSTLQVGSAYSQINFMQKIRFKPNKRWDFEYAFHLSETSDFNRYDRLYVMRTTGANAGKLRWAEWYYGPQKWKMHHLGLTHSKATRAYDKVRLVAAVQLFEESRFDREFNKTNLRGQQENVRATSVNLDLDKKAGEKLRLNYGAEAVFNLVNSTASLTDIVTQTSVPDVTRYPDGSTWQALGVYANAKYRLTDKWIINTGLRYSTYDINAEFDTTYFPFPFTDARINSGSLSGSAGVVWSPVQSWQLYANAASGFRAPNIDDMGKVFESVPGFLVVPNPDLRPEHVLNAEVGTAKVFGDWLKADAAAYYTWLRDGMVRNDFTFNGQPEIVFAGDTSTVQAIQNVTQIRVYGLQAGIEASFKGFGLRSTISYQNGREQSEDSLIYYPLRHAAPMFGATHLTYTDDKVRLDFYALYNARMDYEDLALTERQNTSYARDEKGQAFAAEWYTLNFKAAWFVSPQVTLTAGIENFMDILYRPYSSGINAPGRNLIASLSARF